MGLDIYLYRYEDYQKSKSLEEQYNLFEKEIWNGRDVDGVYETLNEEEKESISEKIKLFSNSLGLDDWGSCEEGVESISYPCERFPDHYFQIGYFRSSYNEAGIERILKNLGLPRLRDIFNKEDEKHEFQPNWEEALENVKDVIVKLKEKGAYRVNRISQNVYGENTVTSEKTALDIFMMELEKSEESPFNYSNINGDFHLHEPQKVLATISGTYEFIGRTIPCTYVVTESDNTWYINALEIVQETIEFVLSKEDKDKYYLNWSG